MLTSGTNYSGTFYDRTCYINDEKTYCEADVVQYVQEFVSCAYCGIKNKCESLYCCGHGVPLYINKNIMLLGDANEDMKCQIN